MNLSDIIGPVMVGPSSSHTAGAVKIGTVSRKLFGEKITKAEILFHGSFLSTGKGHGTDRAIVAGLMGLSVDDDRIPDSFQEAEKRGFDFTLSGIDLGESAHPNSVKLILHGENDKKMEIVAASVGGGRINIVELDGISANFSGDMATLIVHNVDTPGHVAKVTGLLHVLSINIATMQLYRSKRGGDAVMVIECDSEVPEAHRKWLAEQDGIIRVTYLSQIPEELSPEDLAHQYREKKVED